MFLGNKRFKNERIHGPCTHDALCSARFYTTQPDHRVTEVAKPQQVMEGSVPVLQVEKKKRKKLRKREKHLQKT